MRNTLFYVLIVFVFGMAAPAVYAAKVELTTYYPAPYGEYSQLKSKKLAAGDNLPNRDGDIRLTPQTGDPSTWTAGTAGQIAYSSVDDALYHNNGTAWVATGGGGGASYTDYSLPAGRAVGSACSVSGFTVKGSLGTWGYCRYYASDTDNTAYLRPPGGACASGWILKTVGEAYLCGQ